MANYYVNTSAQINGDHEVHVDGCGWMPSSKVHLGDYFSCGPAVEQSKRYYYSQSNGCRYCCPACHTS